MESPPPAVFHDKAKRTQQGDLLGYHGNGQGVHGNNSQEHDGLAKQS